MSGAAAITVGGANFAPITRDYATGTAATETIPTGAAQMIVAGWGGGAGGSHGTGVGCSADNGGAGGAGAYCEKTFALTAADWGQTLTYSVGAPGGVDLDGGNSTLVNGTFSTSVNISANGGQHGRINEVGGGGGLASGATTNTNGTAGTGTASDPGPAGVVGQDGSSYGAGGNASAVGTGNLGTAGAVGHWRFKYS